MTSHFLYPLWRKHIAKAYDDERAATHGFAARQRVDRLVAFLDEETPDWRAGRIKAVDLKNGQFDEDDFRSKDRTSDVLPLFDELTAQKIMALRVAAFLEVPGVFLRCHPPMCDPYPRSLLLVIDPDVPASTVAALMNTAAEAEVDHFQLMVRDTSQAVPVRIESKSVDEMHSLLQRLISAFDVAPTCSIASVEVPLANTEDVTMSYLAMVETVAAVRAVDELDHVYVEPVSTRRAGFGVHGDCSRTYVVGE